MNEILQDKGLVKLGEDKIYVTGLKGPLEARWEMKVDAFATALCANLVGGSAVPVRAPREAA